MRLFEYMQKSQVCFLFKNSLFKDSFLLRLENCECKSIKVALTLDKPKKVGLICRGIKKKRALEVLMSRPAKHSNT